MDMLPNHLIKAIHKNDFIIDNVKMLLDVGFYREDGAAVSGSDDGVEVDDGVVVATLPQVLYYGATSISMSIHVASATNYS